MKIQLSTGYAIRILRYLHGNAQTGEVFTAQQIAEAVGMTYPFFIKIANQLKKAELIRSIQGRNGGYMIAKHGDKISIYDVFLAIEGRLNIHHYTQKYETGNRKGTGCPLYHYFGQMQENIIRMMTNQKIADFDGVA